MLECEIYRQNKRLKERTKVYLRKKSEVFRLRKEYIPYKKVSISQFDEGNAIQIFDRLGTDRGVIVLKNGQPMQLFCRRRNIQGL